MQQEVPQLVASPPRPSGALSAKSTGISPVLSETLPRSRTTEGPRTQCAVCDVSQTRWDTGQRRVGPPVPRHYDLASPGWCGVPRPLPHSSWDMSCCSKMASALHLDVPTSPPGCSLQQAGTACWAPAEGPLLHPVAPGTCQLGSTSSHRLGPAEPCVRLALLPLSQLQPGPRTCPSPPIEADPRWSHHPVTPAFSGRWCAE